MDAFCVAQAHRTPDGVWHWTGLEEGTVANDAAWDAVLHRIGHQDVPDRVFRVQRRAPEGTVVPIHAFPFKRRPVAWRDALVSALPAPQDREVP